MDDRNFQDPPNDPIFGSAAALLQPRLPRPIGALAYHVEMDELMAENEDRVYTDREKEISRAIRSARERAYEQEKETLANEELDLQRALENHTLGPPRPLLSSLNRKRKATDENGSDEVGRTNRTGGANVNVTNPSAASAASSTLAHRKNEIKDNSGINGGMDIVDDEGDSATEIPKSSLRRKSERLSSRSQSPAPPFPVSNALIRGKRGGNIRSSSPSPMGAVPRRRTGSRSPNPSNNNNGRSLVLAPVPGPRNNNTAHITQDNGDMLDLAEDWLGRHLTDDLPGQGGGIDGPPPPHHIHALSVEMSKCFLCNTESYTLGGTSLYRFYSEFFLSFEEKLTREFEGAIESLQVFHTAFVDLGNSIGQPIPRLTRATIINHLIHTGSKSAMQHLFRIYLYAAFKTLIEGCFIKEIVNGRARFNLDEKRFKAAMVTQAESRKWADFDPLRNNIRLKEWLKNDLASENGTSLRQPAGEHLFYMLSAHRNQALQYNPNFRIT